VTILPGVSIYPIENNSFCTKGTPNQLCCD